jgi:hypothetical protein
MQRSTAVSFAIAGIGLLGLVLRKPRWTFLASSVGASLAVVSLVEYRFAGFTAKCRPLQPCVFLYLQLALGWLKQPGWLPDRPCLA